MRVIVYACVYYTRNVTGAGAIYCARGFSHVGVIPSIPKIPKIMKIKHLAARLHKKNKNIAKFEGDTQPLKWRT